MCMTAALGLFDLPENFDMVIILMVESGHEVEAKLFAVDGFAHKHPHPIACMQVELDNREHPAWVRQQQIQAFDPVENVLV